MTDHFQEALARTSKAEGGYTDSGPTYRGIDRRYWPQWPGWAVVDRWKQKMCTVEVRDFELAPLVDDFYRLNFWQRIHGDDLALIDPAVAYLVFDIGVNLDAPDGVRFLQETLNLLNRNGAIYPDLVADGRVGPVTKERLRRLMESSPPRSLEERRYMVLTVLKALYRKHIIEWMQKAPAREEFRGLLFR